MEASKSVSNYIFSFQIWKLKEKRLDHKDMTNLPPLI